MLLDDETGELLSYHHILPYRINLSCVNLNLSYPTFNSRLSYPISSELILSYLIQPYLFLSNAVSTSYRMLTQQRSSFKALRPISAGVRALLRASFVQCACIHGWICTRSIRCARASVMACVRVKRWHAYTAACVFSAVRVRPWLDPHTFVLVCACVRGGVRARQLFLLSVYTNRCPLHLHMFDSGCTCVRGGVRARQLFLWSMCANRCPTRAEEVYGMGFRHTPGMTNKRCYRKARSAEHSKTYHEKGSTAVHWAGMHQGLTEWTERKGIDRRTLVGIHQGLTEWTERKGIDRRTLVGIHQGLTEWTERKGIDRRTLVGIHQGLTEWKLYIIASLQTQVMEERARDGSSSGRFRDVAVSHIKLLGTLTRFQVITRGTAQNFC
jgi:hypothetical protein